MSDGRDQRLMVALGLIGVGPGKSTQGPLGLVTRAEICPWPSKSLLHLEAEHHPALGMLRNVAMRHPQPGVADV
jgi:hypothetical protein